MTPSLVDDKTPGTLILTGRDLPDNLMTGSGTILYDAEHFRPHVEPIEIDDPRLAGIWGSVLYRVNLRALAPKPKDSWRLRIIK